MNENRKPISKPSLNPMEDIVTEFETATTALWGVYNRLFGSTTPSEDYKNMYSECSAQILLPLYALNRVEDMLNTLVYGEFNGEIASKHELLDQLKAIHTYLEG